MRTKNLNSYIAGNFKELQAAAIKTKRPLFGGELEPEQYEYTVKVLTALSKNMTGIPLQIEKIHAILASMDKHNRAVFSGDTGIGKTFTGIATAFVRAVEKLSNNPKGHYNAYVVAPPHLVKKWGNEAKKMLKGVIEVNVIEVKTFKDVYSLTKKANFLQGFNIFVVSKNKNSLTYQTKPSWKTRKWYYSEEKEIKNKNFVCKEYKWDYICHSCGGKITDSTPAKSESGFDIEAEENPFKRKNPKKCRHCHATLSSPVRGKTSPAEFIARYGKTKCIDMLIVDELHEEKAKNTLRASAFGQLIAKSKEVLGLTGTFLGGYASHAFYTLFRMFPSLFIKDLYMGWNDVEKFILEFGGSETHTQIIEYDEYEQKAIELGRSYGTKERADLSPRLLDILLPMVIFARLDELKFLDEKVSLPKYTEISHKVEHETFFAQSQQKYLAELAKASNYEFKTFKDRQGYGKLKTDALLIPDMPFKETSIEMHVDEDEIKDIKYVPPVTREEYPVTNKERKLIETIKDAYSQNRRCLVYHDFVNAGLREDLMELISKETGLKIVELKSSIGADKREVWLKKQNCDVLITNPELVKTGLDLLEYPTIIFYEQVYSSYNVFTMRQAAKRAWRIGQTKDCEVHSIAYTGTAQQHALNLIGSKMNISQGVEGRLSTGSDIASEAEEENIQIAMARALLNNEKIEAEATGSSSKTLDLNAREWSEFEKFYIRHLEEYKVNPDEYTKLIPKTETIKPKPSAKAKKVKAVKPSKFLVAPVAATSVETSVKPEMLTKAGEQIVFIEERIGRGRMAKRIKKAVSANEASQLAKESGKHIQLSLF